MNSSRNSNIGEIIFICILILALGGLFIGVFSTEDPFWKPFFASLIASIFASLIISIYPVIRATDALKVATQIQTETNRLIDFIDQKNNNGIKRIKLSNEINKDFWVDIIHSCNTNLDLLSHGLDKWLKDEFKDVFFSAMSRVLNNKEGSVRILINKYICDKSSTCRDRYCLSNTDKIKRETHDLINLINTKILKNIIEDKDINDNDKTEKMKRLVIKWTNSEVFYNSFIKTDIEVFVSPYVSFPDTTNSKVELLLKRDSPLAHSYINDFNKLFELETSTLIQKNTNSYYDVEKTIKYDDKRPKK